MDYSDLEACLESICEGFDIVAVYLYGSVAREEEDEISDLDVGVVFEDYSLDKEMCLASELDKELEISRDLDLQALNSVEDPVFLFNVIQDGKIVYEGDMDQRLAFEREVERRYHDMKPLVDEYREEMKKRVV
jgi:predicted nucleotidyltransferase